MRIIKLFVISQLHLGIEQEWAGSALCAMGLCNFLRLIITVRDDDF